MKYKFELGEYVELVGIYRTDKPLNYKGKIIDRASDLRNLEIGASINVYVVEGVGTYGERALKKSK